MHESIVFCSTCTTSSYRKFTFAISSADEFLVLFVVFLLVPVCLLVLPLLPVLLCFIVHLVLLFCFFYLYCLSVCLSLVHVYGPCGLI